MKITDFRGTADVADDYNVSRSFARNWAAEHGVALVAGSYVWSPQEVEHFVADLEAADDPESDVDDLDDDEADCDDDSEFDEDEAEDAA